MAMGPGHNASPAGQDSPVCFCKITQRGGLSGLLDTQLLQEVPGQSDKLGTYREFQSVPGVWQELRPYLVWKLLRVEEMWNRPVDL